MTLLEKSFLKNNDKYLINNGINLSTYKPTIGKNFLNKFNIQNKFIILGVANKWEERKGFSFFLKLSRLISKDFVIVIVGLSKKQELNLPKNIVSIKRTDSIEELVEVYSNSNVLFNPTLEDNFPTVNLESIACGTPVVTFNTGGSGESISSQTGFIVPKGDLNEVINSIENIKKVGKESFATSCREFALKNFDVKITNGKYIELYKNLSNNL
jgi:glycosyltransferase involved in cell wall biosynthesis